MARMHSKAKGKSGSKHPENATYEWVASEPAEIKDLIIKLAKSGNPPSKIGLILRDQYGIPSVKALLGVKINAVLSENNLKPAVPEDIQSLIYKSQSLRKHLLQHKKDLHNRRVLHLIESKILRLTKYYKKSGRLPEGWRYEPSEVQLHV